VEIGASTELLRLGTRDDRAALSLLKVLIGIGDPLIRRASKKFVGDRRMSISATKS
jgi:hypothetical protein